MIGSKDRTKKEKVLTAIVWILFGLYLASAYFVNLIGAAIYVWWWMGG